MCVCGVDVCVWVLCGCCVDVFACMFIHQVPGAFDNQMSELDTLELELQVVMNFPVSVLGIEPLSSGRGLVFLTPKPPVQPHR